MFKWIQQALCEHDSFGKCMAGSKMVRGKRVMIARCKGCDKVIELKKAK